MYETRPCFLPTPAKGGNPPPKTLEFAKKHDVFVLINRTDVQWKDDETSKRMIVGILCAVRDTLAMIGDIGKSKVPTIMVALRGHIWDSVHFNDSNKMRQYTEFLP